MKSIKKTLILLCLITFLSFPLKPKAVKEQVTFGDALDILEDLRKQKKDKDNEVAISEAEYKRISNEILKIEEEIAILSTEIQEATKQIAELEKDIEKKKDETDNILVFLQLSEGEKSYLEYVFKAKTFTDFIHRVSIVEQLGKYNKEQIKEMNELIVKNNKLKEQNAKTISAQEIKKSESRVKMKELGSKIDDLVQDGIGIDEELAEKEKEIQRMRDSGCKNRNDLLAVCDPLVTATGFLRPLESARISSEYSWRTSPMTGLPEVHSGIDLAAPEWTKVYPVATGRIAYIVYRSSCGGNMVYMYHTVKGKQYTSVYMHLIDFGNIKVGQTVDANYVIGYVGGDTTRKSKGGYDGCTFGAHLHLTLARGWTLSHRSSMFNPREVITFPAKGSTFRSRVF